MDHLSSCYFCGASLDVSLSEYPVVPKRLHPDGSEQQTVVLCPTCRRKLATVVESVVAAAEADAPASESEFDDEDHSDVVDQAGVDPQEELMDVSDANETDDGSLLGDPSEPTESGDDSDLLRDASAGESEQAADSARADDAEANQIDETNAPEPNTETADASDDEAGDGADEEASDPALTRLEYSKVMRLLQNRDLPVDRRGFREVATSAYDIENEQFDAIIDAAVDRGLIGEDGGQLTSAE